MNIILSNEQIRKVFKCTLSYSSCKECGTECDLIAKAQAQHIFKLLNERCREHLQMVKVPMFDEFDDPEQPEFPDHRYLCPDCMKEIEEKLK